MEKYSVWAKAQRLLSKRGGDFLKRDLDRNIYFMIQRSPLRGLRGEPYRIFGMGLAVVIDYNSCIAEVISFDEDLYVVHEERTKLPTPVHMCEFKRDLTGMTHIKVANALEKLFFEIHGIDAISGIRSA